MTEINPIFFPGLGLKIDPNPVAFSIAGQPIYWYGIIIGCGFLLAVTYVLRQCRRANIEENAVLDFLLIVTPLSIVGARLYYVLWNLSLYETLLDVINIRKGGLAIYGAIITAVVISFFYFKKKKIPLLSFLDIGVMGLFIGQAVGRWGNFINREAYGSLTDLPWRMEIFSQYYNGRVMVHPTFLYESLWNVLGFLLLHFYSKKKKFNGEIFLMYLGWYGLGRSMIEGLRTDSLYLFGTGVRVSQLVGILSFLAAGILLTYLYRGQTYRRFALLGGPSVKEEREEEKEETGEEIPAAAPAEEAGAKAEEKEKTDE